MESLSLAVTFLIIVIVYEFLKPKSDNESTNLPKNDTDEED
jgi:hypothetical protein